LERLGILSPQGYGPKSNFSQLSKALKLVNEYESNISQFDVSYAYAGYAPISLRIIQLASLSLPGYPAPKPNSKPVSLSFQGSADILNLLPGPTVETDLIPENKSFKSASNYFQLNNP
jgi:hypothetical protein